MLTKSCKKVATNFSCKNCDYNTSRKSSYEKHMLSTKHNSLTFVNEKLQENCKTICTFTCTKCNKIYKSRVGLWKHNKLCIDNQEILQFQNTPTNPSLLLEVLKQNQEFKDLIIEQNKQNQQLTKQVLELQSYLLVYGLNHIESF